MDAYIAMRVEDKEKALKGSGIDYYKEIMSETSVWRRFKEDVDAILIMDGYAYVISGKLEKDKAKEVQ